MSLAEWVTSPYLAAVLCPLPCSWLGTGRPWSAVMPGAYILLPSLLEVLQGFAFGLWRKRNGDACPYSWVLPPRTAPAPGNAGGVQCVMWSKWLKNSAHWLVLFVSWCTMAFYAGEEEGGWNFLRACGLCVQGIAVQKCICLCLLWCGWSGSSAMSGQCCQLALCPLLAVPTWLGALQRARWPRLSCPRCVPWALQRAASTGVSAAVGVSAQPWEPCVPGWKQDIFSLESLGGGGKAVVGSGDRGAVL